MPDARMEILDEISTYILVVADMGCEVPLMGKAVISYSTNRGSKIADVRYLN